MAQEGSNFQESSPLPDSISEVEEVRVEGTPEIPQNAPANTTCQGEHGAASAEHFPTLAVSRSLATSSSIDPIPSFAGPGRRLSTPESSRTSGRPDIAVAPVLSLSSDFHLAGSSSSAFRPFITQAPMSSGREITSSSETQMRDPITMTPILRRTERLSTPVAPRDFSNLPEFRSKSPSPTGTTQQAPVLLGESSNTDDNEDGRTTASAPPCTPAPDPYQQPQSPFRGNRQIKKIDLLAMSRSRQSDRAENARRDGRLAPSPRKKDEVLRNSGFVLPARTFGAPSTMRLGSQTTASGQDRGVSPERGGSISLTSASPNVDVVSIDDSQSDPNKCTFSIQFHDFAPAEQMMKCNLCGFVTNNQRFYRRHRRLHSRQYQPNLIHCSLCDYSTTQIRKMREHTISHHHLSHPNTMTASSHDFGQQPSTLMGSGQRPAGHGHLLLGQEGMYQPAAGRHVNLPLGTPVTAVATDTTGLGLPTYIPHAPQNPGIHVNTQADLQHPPRGSAMLGNYQQTSDQQMTTYMRSVLNNLITPARVNPNSSENPPLGIQAARNFPYESQSTVLPSSSIPVLEESYNYRRLWNGVGNQHLNNGFIKVKTEPRPPVMSHTRQTVADAPSSTQDRGNLSPRRRSDAFDSESGMDVSSDDHLSSPQPDVVNCRADMRHSLDASHTESSSQAEDFSANSNPRSLPYIKIEFPQPHNNSCSMFNHQHHTQVDQGVQCEIISMSRSHRQGSRTQSETVSSAGGSATESRCYFCGVTFDDEVLYSIHIGCHSHTDPFVCNVCGKQCHNKYGFYSHIMRGHQARPNT